jgi:hypothetical protein
MEYGVQGMEYGAYGGGGKNKRDTHRGKSGHGSSCQEWAYEIIKRTFGVVVSGKSPWSPHLRYGVRCPDSFGVHFFHFSLFQFFCALLVSYPLLPRHAIRPSDYAELSSL